MLFLIVEYLEVATYVFHQFKLNYSGLNFTQHAEPYILYRYTIDLQYTI